MDFSTWKLTYIDSYWFHNCNRNFYSNLPLGINYQKIESLIILLKKAASPQIAQHWKKYQMKKMLRKMKT